MLVSLIAAVAQNGTIGRQNQLPWQIEEDMAFFLNRTEGHVVISGRKNFEAMGAPLPRRTNVVLTRDQHYSAPGAAVTTSIEQALRYAKSQGETEAFVIGGAQVYALAFPYADRYYRTTVLSAVAGDVKFPDLDLAGWTTLELKLGVKSAVNEHAFKIEQLSRPAPPASFDA